MFHKILIANRGEIALRIVRACAESNIRSVAIYTEPDRYALHVKQANEAVCIGPHALDGYLNAHHIVNVALSSNCDAIHPGYGFLSENPLLAEVCQKRGIVFIGPPASLIEKMGDKQAAKMLAKEAGIPLIPGSDICQNEQDALRAADKIGFPVMLKATNGGGGRGLRVCCNSDDIKNAFKRVTSEVSKTFGNGAVFVEKLLEETQHIEVQILADKYQNVCHLFERNCSIQRRHQKLIEIAPSPNLSSEDRKIVCDLAVKFSKHVGYENAGTIEFLKDKSNQFYFLEVNPRLQVEHTITEAITGIDIVKAQIKIAEGKPLDFTQNEIAFSGHALELRVNAEDPKNEFLPDLGKITKYYAPGGPGVRTDSAIYTGYCIPSEYDSLCAKLTVWALDWEALIYRAKRAIKEMKMFGVKTTIPFYLEILNHPDFLKQKFNTDFINAHPELLHYSDKPSKKDLITVISAAYAHYSRTNQ